MVVWGKYLPLDDFSHDITSGSQQRLLRVLDNAEQRSQPLVVIDGTGLEQTVVLD